MKQLTIKIPIFALAIVTLLVFSLSIASANLEEGLVVYFSFDQGKTNEVRDLSETGNNGIVKGNPGWVKGPKPEFGKAIEFDGISDYIEVPNNETMDVGEDDITFALWINQADQQEADHPRPVSKMPLYGTDKPGFDLITFGTTSAAMQIFYGMSGAARQATTAVKNIVDGEWHHVAIMKDGDMCKLYIDGELDASTVCAPVDIDNDYPFVVGANAQVAAHVMFKGAVDEVAFYTRVCVNRKVIHLITEN